jgi:lipoate-protein ligase A
MNVRIFDLLHTPPLPAARNMAVDETLLFRVASGARGPLFRLWDWSERALVLGSYQSVANEIDMGTLRAEGFAFTRRISGGGTMIVEPGRAVTWSLIVPESLVDDMSFVDSFAFLDRWAVDALRAMGVPCFYRPINDIATADGKLAGAAQCRRRRTVLHHATMAVEFDNDLMLRLQRLRRPVLNPKGMPSAVKTVAPLRRYLDLPIEELRRRFAAAFARAHATRESALSDDELAEAEERATDKFLSREWLWRVP